MAFYLAGAPEADRLLAENPFALLVGMVLDQQVPMERAFSAPFDLCQRLGGTLEAEQIASMDPDALQAAFAAKPALHRFPGSMAARVQQLARVLVEDYDGRADAVWSDAADGQELLRRVRRLPGFGEQKAQIFIALLAKRLGVRPAGWEQAAGNFGAPGFASIADIDGPEALQKVRDHKREVKAAVKGLARLEHAGAPKQRPAAPSRAGGRS